MIIYLSLLFIYHISIYLFIIYQFIYYWFTRCCIFQSYHQFKSFCGIVVYASVFCMINVCVRACVNVCVSVSLLIRASQAGVMHLYFVIIYYCHLCGTVHTIKLLVAVSIWKGRLTSIGILMLKIRRSHDRLIFNMGISIPRKDGLYIEKRPWILKRTN